MTKIESYSHNNAKRKNIPTEQQQNFVVEEELPAEPLHLKKRNPDLDPQLMWRGKYDSDDDYLTIRTKPLYIQEKISPKSIIANLQQHSANIDKFEPALFEDMFSVSSSIDQMEFYKHEQNWTNRMILGDSLQVMASLAEREGLRNKVQCIYFDPPYGIKFNSNFQWSTTTRNVVDGKAGNMTREPEQVKAFRDTWKDGIHSYLSYIRDRLIVMRDLLNATGSIFVQIGDENVHRVRCVLEEVFGEANFVSQISYATTSGFSSTLLPSVFNHILWFAKDKDQVKFHQLFQEKKVDGEGASKYRPLKTFDSLKCSAYDQNEYVRDDNITSQGESSTESTFVSRGRTFVPGKGLHWKTSIEGLKNLDKAGRIIFGKRTLGYLRRINDFAAFPRTNFWDDIGGVQSRSDPKIYVVQTSTEAIARCLLMASDPGDLVLDPTCGSGTTAYVAEQYGRRWITMDTSRVALALARTRLMGAKFPYYIIRDSQEGAVLEAKLDKKAFSIGNYGNSLLLGFVYERVPRITLKSIAFNTEIPVIHSKYEKTIQGLLREFNQEANSNCELWEVSREPDSSWSPTVLKAHKDLWDMLYRRQKEINKSISDNAPNEILFDKPYENKSIIRVTGPFTVESLSPHRILSAGTDGKIVDPLAKGNDQEAVDFAAMILENLRSNGIQTSDKSVRLDFVSLEEFPGSTICAEGRYMEGEEERKAAILIGPEFGSLTRIDLVAAANEAIECGFDMLVAAAFHFDGQSTDLTKLGRFPVMKVMMNTDLMMGDALKGKGNLFVAFGEPDIAIEEIDANNIRIAVRGVDIFFPNTGEVRSDNEDGIACWFIDTDYDQESFFVRHAYFLGAKNPYESLKKSLKADINQDAWESIHSSVSRPFKKPASGYVAVKIINHLGDEVMKVIRV